MRPTIGFLSEIDNEKITSVWNTYVSAIVASGGTPVILPYTNNETALAHFIDLCDGFLFTGGVDIDPVYYGEKKSEFCGDIQAFRDEFELSMFEKIIAADKPILAICRGIQLVNVALGGTLYQDIPSEYETDILHRQTEGKHEFSHDIIIKTKTPIYDLLGTDRIKGNSFHHQALKTLGDGLVTMAYADDGIIEAVYHTEHRYLRAYQWHPERLFENDENNAKLFDEFIFACTL